MMECKKNGGVKKMDYLKKIYYQFLCADLGAYYFRGRFRKPDFPCAAGYDVDCP